MGHVYYGGIILMALDCFVTTVFNFGVSCTVFIFTGTVFVLNFFLMCGNVYVWIL